LEVFKKNVIVASFINDLRNFITCVSSNSCECCISNRNNKSCYKEGKS
jgi:hypothetical protein